MQVYNHSNTTLCSEIYPELVKTIELLYQPYGFIVTDLIKESESKEYSACSFSLSFMNITFRAAHKTPRKIGQFVTLWKRVGMGPIQPFDLNDPIDLFVISVHEDEHSGQFVFPKAALFDKKIISLNGHGGKRAIRVYPPWDVTESRQAKNTQAWQLEYFLDHSQHGSVDCQRMKKLYFRRE